MIRDLLNYIDDKDIIDILYENEVQRLPMELRDGNELFLRIENFKKRHNIDSIVEAVIEYCYKYHYDIIEVGKILRRIIKFRDELFKDVRYKHVFKKDFLIKMDKEMKRRLF